ncbi:MULTISPECIES: LysR family transcriptional regulator [Sinorhizobium]|uniref:LysR family transcriptional regulator n=2 Tax=Sinorhizobium TaxID=28105 RepID=A0A2S3YGB7_9HYPH|nr:MULTISPECIES: LysR family transcriptional regulator [Sinorhizobium]ASY58235.1 Transcriptional regulator, LysR family [Sinorhizobium sp. CCBAU 05631]AUX77901.1 LysR family transcriptional regulator protein [Sinorhizobium fredii]PDT40197.1 LysR family transcriptional regulator [Sinorhizobium sp. FG01]POH25282.1 LysR family transcriptional regulator [Sinorhizobium americanum]
MSRPSVNRSGEMEVFAKAVELGGFSSAARHFRMTPSAVSKLVLRLEERLGVRLVNRSTRKLQLTPEGHAFYERTTRILSDIDEAERCASAGESPTGRVRLNVNASFGTHVLMPLVPKFRERFPAVTLDIVQTDAVVDLMEARADVAVRAGPLKSSTLIARKLGATRMVIVSAPSYLARNGMPSSLDELRAHDRLGFCYARAVDGWPLRQAGETIVLPASGAVQVSDGEGLRHLALAGAGLARLAEFTVREDMRAGRLLPVLEDLNPGDLEEIHAVFLGQGGALPSRVRAVLDFLASHARVTPMLPDELDRQRLGVSG